MNKGYPALLGDDHLEGAKLLATEEGFLPILLIGEEMLALDSTSLTPNSECQPCTLSWLIIGGCWNLHQIVQDKVPIFNDCEEHCRDVLAKNNVIFHL